jgi:hypothetical protein
MEARGAGTVRRPLRCHGSQCFQLAAGSNPKKARCFTPRQRALFLPRQGRQSNNLAVRCILSGKLADSVLPRFYFDTFDGDHSASDSEGIDCATMKNVQDCAVDALPDMAREMLPDGANRMFRVSVRDDGGQVVFKATLELKSTWLRNLGEKR